MSQSLVKNYIHLIFSTRQRQPLLDDPINHELYPYIGGICTGMECYPVKVGGYTDHVHALFLLSKKITLIKAVEEIKGESSKWIKTKGAAYQGFYWQGGYGAFSVNPSEVDTVTAYIETQKEYHQRFTFQQEYMGFLKKYGVAYDERYVWD